ELGSVEAIKELVGAGLGYGILPAMAVSGQRRRGGLVVRPLTPRLSRSLALVLRRDRRLDRGAAEGVEALFALETSGLKTSALTASALKTSALKTSALKTSAPRSLAPTAED